MKHLYLGNMGLSLAAIVLAMNVATAATTSIYPNQISCKDEMFASTDLNGNADGGSDMVIELFDQSGKSTNKKWTIYGDAVADLTCDGLKKEMAAKGKLEFDEHALDLAQTRGNLLDAERAIVGSYVSEGQMISTNQIGCDDEMNSSGEFIHTIKLYDTSGHSLNQKWEMGDLDVPRNCDELKKMLSSKKQIKFDALALTHAQIHEGDIAAAEKVLLGNPKSAPSKIENFNNLSDRLSPQKQGNAGVNATAKVSATKYVQSPVEVEVGPPMYRPFQAQSDPMQ